MTLINIYVEHLRNALGIGTSQPRLSWITETNIQRWMQTGYEIEVFDLNGNLRDRSGRVKSTQSVLIEWPFAPLVSREGVSVRVRVWGNDASPSDWSDLFAIETGLLSPSDWSARFISPDLESVQLF